MSSDNLIKEIFNLKDFLEFVSLNDEGYSLETFQGHDAENQLIILDIEKFTLEVGEEALYFMSTYCLSEVKQKKIILLEYQYNLLADYINSKKQNN